MHHWEQVKYFDDCSGRSDSLSQPSYHVVYLSSKGPADCAADIDKQIVDSGQSHDTDCSFFYVGKDKNIERTFLSPMDWT